MSNQSGISHVFMYNICRDINKTEIIITTNINDFQITYTTKSYRTDKLKENQSYHIIAFKGPYIKAAAFASGYIMLK